MSVPKKVPYTKAMRVLEDEAYAFLANERVMERVEAAVEKYGGELTLRELDFARRYATEVRSIEQWTAVYNVSRNVIYRMLNNVNVQNLINAIKMDFSKHFLQKMARAANAALNFCIEVLEERTTEDNTDTKLRAGGIVLGMIKGHLPEDGHRPEDTGANSNANGANAQAEMRVAAEVGSDNVIDLQMLKEKVKSLETLEKGLLRRQERLGGKHDEDHGEGGSE